MQIDDLNGAIINSSEVTIHDDVFKELIFDFPKNELCLLLAKAMDADSIYTIRFFNLIGMEMTSCNFWGKSPHVLDFEYIDHDKRIILPKLYDVKRNTAIHPLCKLEDDKKYMETAITFVSGDKLIVACEYISITDRNTGDGNTGDGSVC